MKGISNFRLLFIFVVVLGISSCSSVSQVKIGIQGLKLNQLAMDAYLEKNYEKAADLFSRALEINQQNTAAAYNLACCHALQGDAVAAAKLLTTAFANGFHDIEYMQHDPDFNEVRDTPVFRSVVKKIEKSMDSEDGLSALSDMRIEA
ncbi:MAG: tetratricopeptide repeat protein [Candidatus Marinimicrobia bacterium]|nr:tetratricopeptide repeat protein [Candidatus Neomarinimicrobiota bacterium]MCF7850293.1 tetratricopeptide repeat protein [Candidatus Neomarinimicrobiota bacterium]MCF7903810.1 tetratricopeptide repeat protein [Candidatus Neomarinimicrobiota bacterium]